MTSPTPISAVSPDLEARSERPSHRVSALFAPQGNGAERAAHSCLSLFLDAVLLPEAGSNTLAAAIFAHGAANGVARCAELEGRACDRLERALLRKIAGSRRRGVSAWRRTLRDLETTPEGRGLRRCGEEAVHAWLRGDDPAPYLNRVNGALRTSPS
jgi:hypothetical protein